MSFLRKILFFLLSKNTPNQKQKIEMEWLRICACVVMIFRERYRYYFSLCEEFISHAIPKTLDYLWQIWDFLSICC